MNPKYPVYIVSRDRWQENRRYTVKALQRIGVPFKVVIEPEEYEKYASVIPESQLLAVPQKYHDEYDPCMELNEGESQGSGPARNFAWEHSMSQGYARHWVMDDNIQDFYRLNHNRDHRVADGTIFRIMEDFVERYENVALAGPHYSFFAPRRQRFPPFEINTRVYSCILIKNDIPFRWRARYNEDTDLSLRVLKAGYATVVFYAFTQDKITTMVVKGGNTDTIYRGGTLEKSKMLVMLHPDVASLTWRYRRWHHKVNYEPFKKNKLIPKPKQGYIIPEGINEYGMRLVEADKT